MNSELNGIIAQLPSATRNMFVDGPFIEIYPVTSSHVFILCRSEAHKTLRLFTSACKEYAVTSTFNTHCHRRWSWHFNYLTADPDDEVKGHSSALSCHPRENQSLADLPFPDQSEIGSEEDSTAVHIRMAGREVRFQWPIPNLEGKISTEDNVYRSTLLGKGNQRDCSCYRCTWKDVVKTAEYNMDQPSWGLFWQGGTWSICAQREMDNLVMPTVDHAAQRKKIFADGQH